MPASDDLDAEQAHLDESRRQLHRMRERTAALDSSAAGDWVSREYLESTFALRMRQLADDPAIPLFFGRLDYGDEEDFHIGRRHISNENGTPMVVDWRAPVSLPFYRATRATPMDVARRRRFGFQHGRLTALEDENLASPDADARSAILEAEIERPRTGPMRDIVATIQPDQDVIVRSELARSVCVQGAPGTGKTAVGLHRAAYLLYAHRDQLHRQGILVVGPNASFLRYIADVLPALGEIEARQTTIEGLAEETLRRLDPKAAVTGTDSDSAATLKGDARMAEVLRRAVWGRINDHDEGLLVARGSRRWRVGAEEVQEAVEALRRRGVRYGAGRAMLPQSLAHRVLVKMEQAGESPDDRVQDAVARSKPVKDHVDATWPALEPTRLLWQLFSDPQLLSAAADGVLDREEQQTLLWDRPPRSPGATRWSVADSVLLDEAADLVERTPSLAHIVVDEAQDLSPMMLRALARRSSTGSLTVLGDLAQATTPWASRTWPEALTHLGKPDAHVEELTQGFRVPLDVIEYAARLLPHIAPTLAPPTSIRRGRGGLAVVGGGPWSEHLRDLLDREGSVGLIAPDARIEATAEALDAAGAEFATVGEENETDEFGQHLDLVPASLAKGLEFDHVLLIEPAAIVAGEPDRETGLRRLYVCLTRAVTTLVVHHDEALPAELAG
ncbi:HelD family protein [Nocardioides sp.]|uniref:HelD family protein n=1 Tax=Nocardioides sp. TaxID=35761 RepID=UPI002D808549|nr:AAA family ATPase [Nocardioides sp.]HET8959939.1 AAA family ATPase [Nocardioides sp.]